MLIPGHGWCFAGLVAAVVLSTTACTGEDGPPVVETPAPAAGTVWAWGSNEYGQLGDGSFNHQDCLNDLKADCSYSPVQVAGLTGVIALSGARDTGYALTAEGTVWSWGSNYFGELGDGLSPRFGNTSSMHGDCGRNWGNWDCSPTPVQVVGLSGVIAISGGHATGYALTADGTVWAWGDNDSGQLGGDFREGRSDTEPNCMSNDQDVWSCSAIPVRVGGLAEVVAISAGGGTGYALKADGTVWAWGSGFLGQLGDGNDAHQKCDPYWESREWEDVSDCSPIPVQVAGLTDVTAIGSGYNTGYALKSDGTVWAWGDNALGELGIGDDNNLSDCATSFASPCVWSPVQVPGLAGVTAISGGGSAGHALKTDGTVWTWGDGNTEPVQVAITDVSAIYGGRSFAYALKKDGSLWGWGENPSGVIGSLAPTAALTPPTFPLKVISLEHITAVSAGANTGYVLLNT